MTPVKNFALWLSDARGQYILLRRQLNRPLRTCGFAPPPHGRFAFFAFPLFVSTFRYLLLLFSIYFCILFSIKVSFCQERALVHMISDTSPFLSLRGAIATKQSLGDIPCSTQNRLRNRNEIATPSARNDREGYYSISQAYKVSLVYLN